MLFTANVLVALIAFLHVYIMLLEMFWWDKPLGLKAFGQSYAQAAASKVLAANQGLYNGFLAAGLGWGLLEADTGIKLFFLSCIVIAGIFGAATANKRILFIQAVPAFVALMLLLLA